MMTETKMNETKDHQTIKNWFKTNNAIPARLGYASVETEADPYYKDPLTAWFKEDRDDPEKNYQEIDWEEWLAIFDHHKFTFFYESAEGENRNFLIRNKED